MFNEVDNCADCGKLLGLRNGICRSCYQKELDALDKVKKFLRRNKDVDFTFTVQKTGVSEHKIKKFIEEGRINTTSPNFRAFNCQICKTPISKGLLCLDCSTELKGPEMVAPAKEQQPTIQKGFQSFNRFK